MELEVVGIYTHLTVWLTVLCVLLLAAILFAVMFVVAPAVKNTEQLLLEATEPKPCRFCGQLEDPVQGDQKPAQE